MGNIRTATGQLSGAPTTGDEGTTSNILISVSDGTTTTVLPAFNVTVMAAADGTASISWTPPTTNEDGSVLDDLAGYKLYYGTTSDTTTADYTSVINVPSGVATYLIENFAPATYYFAVTAYDFSGNESVLSGEANKIIP